MATNEKPVTTTTNAVKKETNTKLSADPEAGDKEHMFLSCRDVCFGDSHLGL